MLKKLIPGLIGLSALALTGRLLGFAREILMASKFGATVITDAYLTTLLLFDIAIAANSSILSGTLSYSTDVDLKTFSKSLFSTGIKIFVIIFIAAIALYPLTGWLIPILFSKSAEAAQIVLETSRLLFILAAFLAAAGVFSALLQLRGDITNPGKLVIFLNISSIVFLLFTSKYFGIISLPLGFLMGGILFFVYQIYRIRKVIPTEEALRGNLTKGRFNLFSWGAVVLLVFGNSLMPSLSGLIERYFAYTFTAGTFSHYQYAIKIILLPLTIFSFAISTSLLPVQAKFINAGNNAEFMNATNKGILISVVTSLFFVLLFSVLPQPIIQLIYQRGHFTMHDSVETSSALQIMSAGLIPFLLNPILANIFYSLKAVKNLIAINLFFIFIQTAILFSFSKTIPGIKALAVTWVVIGWINNCALIYYLFKVKKIRFSRTIVSRLLIILLITTALIILINYLVSSYFFGMNTVYNLWQTLIKVVLGGLILMIIFSAAVYLVFHDMLGRLLKTRATNHNRNLRSKD